MADCLLGLAAAGAAVLVLVLVRAGRWLSARAAAALAASLRHRP